MKRWNRTRILLIFGLCLMLTMTIACGGGSDSNSGTPAQRFDTPWAMIQYRNYETAASNRFMALLGITDNGDAAQESDVLDADITDSSGTSLTPTADGSFTNNYYTYDCRGGSCAQSGPNEDFGLYARFDTFAADTYSVEAEMSNGQILATDVDFPGMVAIPFVTSASMDSQLNSGDLELSWTNPTGVANWDQVDQIRVYLMDSDNEILLIVRLDPTDESVTIPAALIASAKTLGNGGMTQWYVQTRAFDADNMNYARGYSDNNDLTSLYAVDYSDIQYRTFEPPRAAATRGYVGLSNNGGPIQVSDVTTYLLSASGGTGVTLTSDGIYSYSEYRYDCRSGSCTQSGPHSNSGIWFGTGALAVDTYTMDIGMGNGQAFSVDMSYPGETALPPVTSASMTTAWNSGDLDLSWTNPTGDANWSEVDQIRIIIEDDTNAVVISVSMNTTDTSVTIPESLVIDAEAMKSSILSRWYIQTRAYGATQNNFARGYSDSVAIP